MPADDDPPAGLAALGRLLQICVYAPIGAGAKLIEDTPGTIARARQELSNARFLGRMVVSQGGARLRERLATDAAEVTEPPSVAAEQRVDTVPAAVMGESDDAPEPSDVTDTADTDDEASVVDGLAVPDYDHLPAIDIIGQLESLSVDELDEIEQYERANRRRRTVLGKIDQLRSAS